MAPATCYPMISECTPGGQGGTRSTFSRTTARFFIPTIFPFGTLRGIAPSMGITGAIIHTGARLTRFAGLAVIMPPWAAGEAL